MKCLITAAVVCRGIRVALVRRNTWFGHRGQAAVIDRGKRERSFRDSEARSCRRNGCRCVQLVCVPDSREVVKSRLEAAQEACQWYGLIAAFRGDGGRLGRVSVAVVPAERGAWCVALALFGRWSGGSAWRSGHPRTGRQRWGGSMALLESCRSRMPEVPGRGLQAWACGGSNPNPTGPIGSPGRVEFRMAGSDYAPQAHRRLEGRVHSGFVGSVEVWLAGS